jgi:hypothetical protein
MSLLIVIFFQLIHVIIRTSLYNYLILFLAFAYTHKQIKLATKVTKLK